MGVQTSDATTGQPRVLGSINYISNPPIAGAAQLEFIGEAEEQSTMQTRPHQVSIHSARSIAASLDREGFQIVSHHSALTHFDNIELDPMANAKYLDELSGLLAEVTGAARVLMMLGGAKQRFSERAPDKVATLVNGKPARYPHADNTDASSSAQIAFAAKTVGIDLNEYSRHALYNLWRCVSPPPQDCSLAVCDARSIAAADEISVIAVTLSRIHGEIRHITTGYLNNPNHRWYFFPDMNADEVLIFKAHDTDEQRPRRVAHTAFDNPQCPADAPARASIEVRAVALFK